jgi:hypothetical protein
MISDAEYQSLADSVKVPAKPAEPAANPPDTGLLPGLTMWSQTVGQPFQTGRWRNRMGFAVGNRLGAMVVYLNGSGTYAVPSAYS